MTVRKTLLVLACIIAARATGRHHGIEEALKSLAKNRIDDLLSLIGSVDEKGSLPVDGFRVGDLIRNLNDAELTEILEKLEFDDSIALTEEENDDSQLDYIQDVDNTLDRNASEPDSRLLQKLLEIVTRDAN